MEDIKKDFIIWLVSKYRHGDDDEILGSFGNCSEEVVRQWVREYYPNEDMDLLTFKKIPLTLFKKWQE